MTKRTLLIGSQTYGLTGVNGDVALMAETFAARGFDVTVQVDQAATRAAILDAYEKLIAETPDGSGDPVVVYYSGHGGRTALDGWEGRQLEGARTHLRYIVPFDMAASTESDFRGLLAQELTALQRRLTERTSNVTTILDCCHSGTMSRDPSIMPKAVSRGFSVQAPFRCWIESRPSRPTTGGTPRTTSPFAWSPAIRRSRPTNGRAPSAAATGR